MPGISPAIIIGIVVAVLAIIIFMCNYVKVPPNVALIVSGRKHKYKVKDENGQDVVKRFGYRIVRGGATFVIPFFERVDKLNRGRAVPRLEAARDRCCRHAGAGRQHA